MKKIIQCFVLLMFILVVCACSKNDGGFYNPYYPDYSINSDMVSTIPNGESYNSIVENPFVYTSYEKNSYFSMDSFTASYSNLRRYIHSNMKLPTDIIKTDELINYFDYDFVSPVDNETFSISATMGQTPWNERTSFITIGIKTKEEKLDNIKGNNIVFLIDVSGSMASDNKLPLVKEAFNMLVDTLGDTDCISVVTYASGVKTILDGCYGDNKLQLKQAIQSLKASGATNGGAGLNIAYDLCEKNFIVGGNNRVIIASDGDFNIGVSSQSDLEALVKEKLDSGIYLTALGFGMGNYKDTTMETLAKYGNGGYAYIDNIKEAKKVLVDEIDKTLVTVAKDVKNMVSFNSDFVESYRLIGYENKLLTEDDFNDENKDAGEVGSGHTTVVCYEVVLKEEIDAYVGNLFHVTIHYKDPITNEAKTTQQAFGQLDLNHFTEDYYFVSALVEFSLALRNSSYKGSANYQTVLARLENYCGMSLKYDEYKKEFYDLVTLALEKNLLAEKREEIKIEIYTEFGKKIILLPANSLLTEKDIIQYTYGKEEGIFEVYTDVDFTKRFTSIYISTDIEVFIKKL